MCTKMAITMCHRRSGFCLVITLRRLPAQGLWWGRRWPHSLVSRQDLSGFLIGAVVAGCVQDFIVMVASVRHKGRSLADVARTEESTFTGLVTMFAVLLILLVTLAVLGVVVVNALSNSPWGVFTIGMTIPIAIFMGLYMFKSSPGQIKE